MSARSHARAGDVAWGRMTKVNGELFALTYGAMVKRLLEDHSEVCWPRCARARMSRPWKLSAGVLRSMK
eukprot:scaffold3349_cov246-Pinguiococcus_pyrenoidosus.AAC.7